MDRPSPNVDTRSVLRQLPFFHQLSDAEIEAVARRTVLKSLPRNVILFREGDACRGLYVVLDGSVNAAGGPPPGEISGQRLTRGVS